MPNYPFPTTVNTPEGPARVRLYRKVNGIDSPLKAYNKQPRPYIPPDPLTAPNTVSSLFARIPFFISHRCGGGNWIEFSETAIRMTRTRFYRAIEFSVHRCATGEFVLSHDHTTLDMTGEDVVIHETDWATLSQLKASARKTNAPYQETEGLLLLPEAMELAKNLVIFLDHKPTSSGPGSEQDIVNMNVLFDYLDTIPGAKDRIVWKCFKGGWESAAIARNKGYHTWGAYYGAEITTSPTRLEHFDILGLAYNDAQIYWDAAVATGKHVVGHIIYNDSWGYTALNKGATGLMCAIPQQMGP